MPARGSVQAIGAQWPPWRHSWPGPQLLMPQGATQLPVEQTWPPAHWESAWHCGGGVPGMTSGGKQVWPALQSRVSVQLRSPGRMVPIGSGGALGGGRWTRLSGAPPRGTAAGEIGPPHATRAIRRTKRMRGR
jgi:hypothetical protein